MPMEREYRRRNEKVKLEMVVFTPESVQKDVTVTDAEAAAHSTSTRTVPGSREAEAPLPAGRRRRGQGENRRSARRRRALVSAEHPAVLDARAGAREPHPAEDRGQGRGGSESEGRGLLKQVKAGGDFAELAKKFSEDEASVRPAATSTSSGAAGWCKEFEDVAFSLAPGRSATW